MNNYNGYVYAHYHIALRSEVIFDDSSVGKFVIGYLLYDLDHEFLITDKLSEQHYALGVPETSVLTDMFVLFDSLEHCLSYIDKDPVSTSCDYFIYQLSRVDNDIHLLRHNVLAFKE